MTRLPIFWDLDGTLLSTGGLGWPCMLRASGLGSTDHSPGHYSGLTDFQILLNLDSSHSRSLAQMASAYLECLKVTLYPGSVCMLQEAASAIDFLIRQGHSNLIVTGNHPTGAIIKLHAAGFGTEVTSLPLFGSSLSAIDRQSIAEQAMRSLGISHAIFVGDSLNDVETAQKLNSPSIAVATGHHTASELAESGAEIVLPADFTWHHLVEAIETITD